MDDALCAVWTRAKRSGVAPKTWLNIHKKALNVYFESRDLQAALNVKDNVSQAADALHRLGARMRLGRLLFGELLAAFDCEAFAKRIREQIASLGRVEDAPAKSNVAKVERELYDLAAQEIERDSRRSHTNILFFSRPT